jgi:hypothetical protein
MQAIDLKIQFLAFTYILFFHDFGFDQLESKQSNISQGLMELRSSFQ